MNALIFLPQTAPEEYADRLTLWNAAESAEARKNSRVAREIILALPHELSDSQRLALSRDMALFLVEKYGVAVDMAIHAPQEAHGDDPRNHHAHLLFTTRVVKQDGLGEKTRILDDKEQGPVQIEFIRQVWETLANDALQQAGLLGTRIDRRTLEDQGIDRIPQEHVGKAGTHAEDTDESRSDDEEDDGDETDTGKTGSGDKGHTPSAAKKEASTSSKEKEQHKSKAQTRLALNEEIKRLNEQRAAFSPIPLKDQIKELDRLMSRLDGRVQRLKTLSDKTSLPVRVLSLVKSVINVAKSLIVVRTKDEAALNLRAAERDAKAERQKARYRTTYRASVITCMAEMRENIEILRTRRTQYQNYKAFVEMIEKRVKLVYSTLKAPVLSARTEWKATNSPQTIKENIVTEAIQKREKVPIEYRPTLKQEPLTKNFKTALASSTSPLAINHSTKSVKEVLKGEDSQRAEKSFTASAAPPKDNAERTVWHKEVTVQIRSLAQVRAERTPIKIQEPMDSPKVWNIEVSDRAKTILIRMQTDIQQRKAEIYMPNDSNFSGRFNHPTKIITESEAIQKVRTEAKTARAKIPEDLRGEPYDQEKTMETKEGVSGAWDKASRADTTPPIKTFSMQFNKVTNPMISVKTPAPEPQAPD